MIFFLFFSQNIDCGYSFEPPRRGGYNEYHNDCGYSFEPPRRGGSNEYPQSMFLSRNKKNKVYPSKSQFYYIKVGFKGSQNYRYVFVILWYLGRAHDRCVSWISSLIARYSNQIVSFQILSEGDNWNEIISLIFSD